MTYYDYNELLDNFGYETILQVDDADYSGDSRILFQDGTSYGWLQFGWGSCSGCDALQACESAQEVAELQAQLRSEIRWFDTAAAALTFFQTHDWAGDYSYHNDEQSRFVAEAIQQKAQS